MDLIGQRFHRLLVLRESGKDKCGHLQYLCKCDCGNEKVVDGWALIREYTKSCGCLRKDVLSARRTERTPFLSLYRHLIRQGRYRDIPVTITFEEFLEFTGVERCHYCQDLLPWEKFKLRSSGLWEGNGACSLDRTDSNIGYTKENCVACCWPCNVMKNALTSDKFIEHVKKIFGNSKRIKPLGKQEVYVVATNFNDWREYPLRADLVGRSTVTSIYEPSNESSYVLVHHSFPQQFQQVERKHVYVFSYAAHALQDGTFGLTPAFE